MCAKVKFPLWEPKKGPKFYNASGGHQTAGPVANLKALKASLQKVNCWGNVLIKVLNRSKELLFFPLWEPKKSPNFLKPPAFSLTIDNNTLSRFKNMEKNIFKKAPTASIFENLLVLKKQK